MFSFFFFFFLSFFFLNFILCIMFSMFTQLVACCSVAKPCPTLCTHPASLSLTISQSLSEIMSIELVMLSNHLILSCPGLLLPSIFHVACISTSFFFWLSNTALYIYITICLSFHLLMDIWLVSTFWLLLVVFLWTCVLYLSESTWFFFWLQTESTFHVLNKYLLH